MRRTINFLVCCFMASFAASVYEARASAQCDNDCRRRLNFAWCPHTAGTCVQYSFSTCQWCVFGVGCKNHDPVVAGECGDTLPHPTSVAVYYGTGCTSACKCPMYQNFVEAANIGKDTNPFAAYMKVCR